MQKENGSITIDYMMIIGKYFKSNQDYVNVMKVNKKYQQLVKMYKFNPIGDCRLFKNMETQHFYEYRDIFYRNRDMFMYIYWINKCFIRDYISMIDTTKCVFKSNYINKILKYLVSFDNTIGENLKCTFEIEKFFSKIKNGKILYLVFEYNEIYFGI